MHNRIWVQALCTFPLLSSPVWAQPASPEIEDEITVIGTRIPIPLDEVGGSISVLTAEDLKLRQDVFALDALQATPGLTITQNGTFGGQTSIFIRGLDSDQTLVLIDGVRSNDPSSPGAGFNAANLTAADIDRIEVLRGPQSLLYGSDAIGGVVNVITRRPEPGFLARGEIEGGSFATLRGSASIEGGVERATGRLTVSGIRTNGISKADEDDGNTERDSYNNVTVGGRGRVILAENVGVLTSARVDGGVRYADSKNEFDVFGPETGVQDGPRESEDEELILDGGLRVALFDDVFVNEFRAEHYRLDRVNRDTDTGDQTFEATGESLFMQYQGTVVLPFDQTIAFGVEREVQTIDTANEDDDITITSGFGLWNGRFFDRVTLNAGVRHDDHETFGGETTFRAGASIDIPETGTRLKGSWGQGFKAPTPFQLTFEFNDILPNPDLQPEEATGWDAGVEQTLCNGRLRGEVTYFDTDVENLIEFVAFTPGFAVTYANIERVNTRGVETALEARPTDWITLNANYTYLDTEDETTGLALLRRPEHFATGQATFVPPPLPDLTLTGVITYNGEETDGRGVVDSWVRLDLRAAYALSEQFEIFGRVDNVTNADYQEVFGFGTPGISAFGGVRARFG